MRLNHDAQRQRPQLLRPLPLRRNRAQSLGEDGMPRELRLQRIMRDGELFARYIQESREARVKEEPELVPVPSTHPPMGMRYG